MTGRNCGHTWGVHAFRNGRSIAFATGWAHGRAALQGG